MASYFRHTIQQIVTQIMPFLEPEDSYYQEPLALKLISQGALDLNAIHLSFGNGQSIANDNFAFRFTHSLHQQFSRALLEHPILDPFHNARLDTLLKRFSMGSTCLNKGFFALSLHLLIPSLPGLIPQWDSHGMGTTSPLTKTAQEHLVRMFSKNPLMEDLRSILYYEILNHTVWPPREQQLFECLTRSRSSYQKETLDNLAGHPALLSQKSAFRL